MRAHDSGATLTLTADDLDRVIGGLLTGDRDALILANDLNTRWRKAVDALPDPSGPPPPMRCGMPEGHVGHVIYRPGDREYWCNGNPRPDPEDS